ncbi:MAG TPA: terminase small subunit, partial [Steroidobacteraceae bacterium]
NKKPEKGLTPKQQRFVDEYLVDLNATAAYRRAGYTAKGNAAEVNAARLLRNAQVAQAVRKAMDERAARVEVRQDDVLRELMRLAMCDISQAFDEEGRLRPLHEIPEDVRRAIAGVDTVERTLSAGQQGEDDEEVEEVAVVQRVRKIKFWDKTKALELLGRHLKLYTDKVEHSGTITTRVRFERIRPNR